MKVLDRYLARSLLFPLTLATIAFVTVAVVVDLFERLDTFLDNEVPTQTIVHYYAATLPFLFILTLPVSTLVGVLFSLGGMARRNELIAMTANGVSLYRILRPVLLVGLVTSLIGLALTTQIVPRGNTVSREIYDHEIKGRPKILGRERRDLNYLGMGGRFFLIRHFDGESGQMNDVVVQQFANGTLVHRIDAKSAQWSERGWLFRDGYFRRFQEKGVAVAEPFVERSFPEIEEKPQDFLRIAKDPDEMTFPELSEHVRRSEESGGEVTPLRVDVQMRLCFPFASFIVILLGAPLTSAIRRGGHGVGFALALFVGFVYYVLLEFGRTFGYNGTLPPMFAAWLPNLAFLAIGCLGLWKTRK